MKRITAAAAAIMMIASAAPSAAWGEESRPESAQTAVQADTVSAIGSVSKMFCTTAALQLQERGLLDIDAPVTEYIPGFTMRDERYKDITVRMLMNHTSGLMGMMYDDMMLYDDVDCGYHDRFLENLKNTRLKADPGTVENYCNDGFTLLEIVVERVSGESFTDYVQEHIAAPLGLEKTGTCSKMYGSENTADIFFGGVPHQTDYCMAYGSGGIMSTAPELSRFGTAFFTDNDTLLSQQSKDEMQRCNARDKYEPPFGLGWDMVDLSTNFKTSRDVQLMFKGGSLFHQYAGLMVAPDEKISVSVTMTGGSGSEDVVVLTESLMKYALEENGIEMTFDEPKKMEILDTVDEKYLKMADIYARADGIYKVDFPDGRYMEITELTAVSPMPERYMYTADDNFVLVDGDPASGNAVQSEKNRLLTFAERDGNTYILCDENVYADSFGRYVSSEYYLQRVGEHDAGREIQQAWQARNGKKYYITSLKYSNAYYVASPAAMLNIPDGVSGCAKLMGLNKSVRFTDENRAEGFVKMPGSGARDLVDIEVFTEDGCEYLRTDSATMASEESFPGLTEDICEIALETGCAKWYNIDEMGLKSVTLDIPEKAAVYVYDRFDHVVYSSYMKDYGSSITLPESGKIVFAGESGEKVGIS